MDEVVTWRLTNAEKRIASLDREKADKEHLVALTNEVRALRRTLIAFIVTIAGSAVLFALTVAQLGLHH